MKDAQGNELSYQTKRKIYEETAAEEMVYTMEDVLKTGTAKNMNWNNISNTEAAGKTGTTNNNKDGWFCGVTPYYSIAVWVGYDSPKTLNDLQGSTYPASIWKKSMLSLIDGMPKGNFCFEYITESIAEEEYLPGRDADELLSPGYTVQNYREDHVIAKKVDGIICEMLFLDKNSETYQQDKDAYYEQGLALIDVIYGNTLSKEKTKLLEDAYIQDEKEKAKTEEDEQEAAINEPAEPEIPEYNISEPDNAGHGRYDIQDAIVAVG